MPVLLFLHVIAVLISDILRPILSFRRTSRTDGPSISLLLGGVAWHRAVNGPSSSFFVLRSSFFVLRSSFFVLLLSLFVNLNSPSAQPQPPQYFAGTGHWYQVVGIGFSWVDSRDSAIALGGYLVSIHSQAENDFVQSLLPGGYPITEAWIGGFERNGENDWQWVSGEPWTYTNWNAGEPSNGCSPTCVLLPFSQAACN